MLQVRGFYFLHVTILDLYTFALFVNKSLLIINMELKLLTYTNEVQSSIWFP